MLVLTKKTEAQIVTDTASYQSRIGVVSDSVTGTGDRRAADTASVRSRAGTFRDTVTTADTLRLTDTVSVDSAASASHDRMSLEQRLGIRISPDALPSPVTAVAKDSAVLNMADNVFYLYGKAQVNYEDMQLNAGTVTYYQERNLVAAVPEFDTLGLAIERPSFAQGQEKFTYDTLQYNFKSKRAIVRNARSQYGEGYVHSEQVKRNPDQSLYGSRSIYTTCALDTPHFGIYAKKIKIIPNRVIASGPANFHIEDVPTPLFLPFGLFPITQGQRSGFKLPTYTIEPVRGLGLRNGGYYFYINDHVDLLLTGNIYSKGSWLVNGTSTYNSRYRYNGMLTFSYTDEKRGEKFEPNYYATKDFLINWQHRSDQKARPDLQFSASVDAGTGSYYQNNTYDAAQIVKNQMRSDITLVKSWPNKPYSMSIAARHSQNTASGEVDVTLPEVNFFLSQFNPFQGRNSTGQRWYEKISFQYSMTGINTIRFIDSTFSLARLSTRDFRNGIAHSVPMSANYNLFRFFTLGINANYKEYWLTEQIYQYYNSSDGGLDTINRRGFYTARDFNTSANITTRIYGLKMFKKGKLAGIRHVVYPTVGIAYTPDYAAAPFRYGYQTIMDASGQYVYRSPYETSVVGAPGFGNFGKFSSNLTYGLNNNLQIKVRTKDSIGSKNITLIDGFSINGSYNIAADSFNWSPVSMNFRTNILNLVNITGDATFDPYVYDYEQRRRINRTVVDAGRGLLRFNRAGIGLDANFRSLTKTNEEREKAKKNSDEYNRIMQYGRYDDYTDFDVPWNLTLRYAFQVRKEPLNEAKKDTLIFDNNINGTVEFNITKRWRLNINTGYNFVSKDLNITEIRLFRDLHCFEMELSAIPFGANKYYSFRINVKAQVLQDLKLIRRRDFRDAALR